MRTLPLEEHTLLYCLAQDNDLLAVVDLEPGQLSEQGGALLSVIRESIEAGGLGVPELVDAYQRGRITEQQALELAEPPEHRPMPSRSVVQSACRTIRERWVERAIADAVADASTLPPSARVERILSRLGQIRSQTVQVKPKSIADLAVSMFQRIDKDDLPSPTITLPWPALSKRLDGGLRPGDYVVVGARPSMGKSTFLRELTQANGSKRILFCSAEDSEDAFLLRAMASQSGVPFWKIRRREMDDDEWLAFGRATGELRHYQLDLYTDPDMSVDRISALAAGAGYDAIVVDYLQMIVQRGPKETEDTGRVSGELKRLAKRENCPVIVASQLNRSLESRPNKRPVMSDLRQSGAIEQDADIVLFLYRDEVYDPDTKMKGVMEIGIGKQRDGIAGAAAVVQLPCDLSKGKIG